MARERIISVDSHAAIPETLVLSHLAPEFHADYQAAKETARQRMLAGKPQKQAVAIALILLFVYLRRSGG